MIQSRAVPGGAAGLGRPQGLRHAHPRRLLHRRHRLHQAQGAGALRRRARRLRRRRTTAKCTWCGAWPATRRSATTRTRTSATARSTCPTRNCTPPRCGGSCRRRCCEAAFATTQEALDGFLGAAYALHIVATVAVMAEARDLQKSVGNGDGAWFVSADISGRGQLRGSDGQPAVAGAGCAVHADRLSVRQLPRRRRPERAAVPASRRTGGAGGRAGRTLRLPRRLPRLRRSGAGGGRKTMTIRSRPRRRRWRCACWRCWWRCERARGTTATIASGSGPCPRQGANGSPPPGAITSLVSAPLPQDLRPVADATAPTPVRRISPSCAFCCNVARSTSVNRPHCRPATARCPASRSHQACATRRHSRTGSRPPTIIDATFARMESRSHHGRLLHFDTETTGLAGGTGTRAFMIGAADWLGWPLAHPPAHHHHDGGGDRHAAHASPDG